MLKVHQLNSSQRFRVTRNKKTNSIYSLNALKFVTFHQQKTKIEKGIKNRNSLDSRQDLNITKTVQDLERKWVDWQNLGSKAFSVRLETENEERANRFQKGENSWKAISSDLATLSNNNLNLSSSISKTVGSISNPAVDPWESVVGFQQI